MITFPNTIPLNGAFNAPQLQANFDALAAYFSSGNSGSVASGLNTTDFATLTGSLKWALVDGGARILELITPAAVNAPLNLTATSQGDYLAELVANGGTAATVNALNSGMAQPAVLATSSASGAPGVTLVGSQLSLTQLAGTPASVAFVDTDGPILLSSGATTYVQGSAWIGGSALQLAASASSQWPGKADETTLTKGPKLGLKDAGLAPRHIGGTYFTASISNGNKTASTLLATLNITNALAGRKALVGLVPTSGAGTITRTSSFGANTQESVTIRFANTTTASNTDVVVPVRGRTGDSPHTPVAQVYAFVTLAAGSNTIEARFQAGANRTFTGVSAYALLL